MAISPWPSSFSSDALRSRGHWLSRIGRWKCQVFGGPGAFKVDWLPWFSHLRLVKDSFLGYFWVKDSFYLIFFLVICWNPWGQKTYCRTLVGRWFPALAVITSQFDPISRYPAATQGHQAERFRKMQAASACVPCNIIQCRCMLWLAVELYQTQRCSKNAKRDNENSVATWQQKTTMESWKVATSLKVCDGLECFVSLTCHVHV